MSTTTMESKGVVFWGDMLGKPIIILISGKAYVGKTTFAKLLHDNFDNRFNKVIRGFAWNVKAIAKQCFGWDYKKDKLGRKLLQNIGNTGREYDEHFWVKGLLDYLETVDLFFPDITIIDDWRFPNEAEYFDNLLYTLIKINIKSEIRGGLDGEAGLDVSETSLDEYEFDYIIENNYETIDEFEQDAIWLAKEILKKENNNE